MAGLFSPDVDTFSTPPSSPTVADGDIRPSLSRRSSRPSSLRIHHNYPPDIVLDEQQSPNQHDKNPPVYVNGAPNGVLPSPSPLTPTVGQQNIKPSSQQLANSRPPVASPCFVHSQLQSIPFTDWLKSKQSKLANHENAGCTNEPPTVSYSNGNTSDEEEGAGSLTKQLAETAVGVREMSKQLGRTRVKSHIHSVLIVTKARDNRLIKLTRELALYLMLRPHHGERGLVVYVDKQLKTSRRFDAAGIERNHPELFVPFPRRRSSSSSSLATNSHSDLQLMSEGQLRYWTAEMCSHSAHLFDFVVTLGGDGTVLFTSWLFQQIVPPVLPFALGSLGFLTNFDFADHQVVMDNAIDAGIRVNLRMRFTCTVYRAVAPEKGHGRKAVKKGDTGEILMGSVGKSGWEALESGHQSHDGKVGAKDKEIMCFTTRPVESFEVLNDLVVDRGPSPYVSLLELFGDEHHLTTVQADGLTISTPTGSTAYSLSAGGSLVHPEIPAILITPICPHTLSFRPMLLPDSLELRICVPFNSRSTAWASFDGRGRVELKQGDHIKVTASKYPFPTVCADSQSTDWFNSITRTLKWNERERQKSFVVVEEGPSRTKRKHKNDEHHAQTTGATDTTAEVLGDEEDEVSDEEEKFDIDDLSSTESSPPSSKISPLEVEAAKSKMREEQATARKDQLQAEAAARVLSNGNPFMRQKSRSRSRTRSGLHSGLETPDRFAGPHPHPPRISPRHVQFAPPSVSSSASSLASILQDQEATLRGERGFRDDIHSPRSAYSARSRIPRDRDLDADLRTPTVEALSRHSRSSGSTDRGHEGYARRAFAVWGQDESDSSAASDSDA